MQKSELIDTNPGDINRWVTTRSDSTGKVVLLLVVPRIDEKNDWYLL